MFGECLIFVYLGLQKHTNAIVKAKMGEDEVLAEYLRNKKTQPKHATAT